MKKAIFLAPAIAAVLALQACSASNNSDDPESKRVYSILQSQELALRNVRTESGFIHTRNALGTEYDTIAIPDRTRSGSYVVILANASSSSEILSVPEPQNGLVLSSRTLDEISRQRLISKPVEQYLRERISR